MKLATHRKTGKSRGFGFVELPTEEDAAAALEALGGAEIDSRKIKLGEATNVPMSERSIKRDGGFGGGGRPGGGRRR